MNQAAVIPPDTIESTDKFHARRTLAFAGTAHALHDGYTDMIYVLLPVSQTQFALGYSALAIVRALYVGSLAALPLPLFSA